MKIIFKKALDNLNVWCKNNGMVINSAKTKVMLITTHQKRTCLNKHELNLKYNNEELGTIMNDKILGVWVDNNLSWTIHVDKVSKKN